MGCLLEKEVDVGEGLVGGVKRIWNHSVIN